MELIGQGRAMAERAGAHTLMVKAAINGSHLLEGAGEHELAAEAARRGIAGQHAGCYIGASSRSLLVINQVEPLYQLGRWDEATAVADGVREFQFTSLPMHRSTLAILAGFIAVARGHTEAAAAARAIAAELLRSTPYEDEHHLSLGTLEISLRLATAGPGRRGGQRGARHRGFRAGRRQPEVRLAPGRGRGRGLRRRRAG